MCLVSELNIFRRLKLFTQVPTGAHLTDKSVSYVQTEKIVVSFPQKMPYHIDGELFFDSKFEISLLPKSLQVIYNANGNHYFNV
ncbi:MAG TPA: hypothetical protein DCQ31_11005 [Bacteroidales bacterium]|nr:hypothetical protein [Bacteroidales bacterium]